MMAPPDYESAIEALEHEKLITAAAERAIVSCNQYADLCRKMLDQEIEASTRLTESALHLRTEVLRAESEVARLSAQNAGLQLYCKRISAAASDLFPAIGVDA